MNKINLLKKFQKQLFVFFLLFALTISAVVHQARAQGNDSENSKTPLSAEKINSKKTKVVLRGNVAYPFDAQRQFISSKQTTVAYKIDNGEKIVVTKNSGMLVAIAESVNSIFNGEQAGVIGSTPSGTARIENIHYEPGLTGEIVAYSGYLYASPIESATTQTRAVASTFLENIGAIEPAYAQTLTDQSAVYFPGLGYNIISPIKPFWNMNRDVSYGIEFIITMVIALLILFRRTNGQSEITILNALPSIILSLVLITFSYALSGLFIDFISVGVNFVQYVLVSSPGSPGYNTIWNGNKKIQYDVGLNLWKIYDSTETITEDNVPKADDITGVNAGQPGEFTTLDGKYGIQADDPLMSVWLVFGTANLEISPEDLAKTSFLPDDRTLNTTPFGGLVTSFAGITSQALGSNNAAAGGTNSLIALLINLVLGMAMFMASIRIFFKLLSAYLMLVVFPIITPFIFLIAAIPTMTMSMIEAFVRPMFSSSLKFIIVYAINLFIVVMSYEPLINQFSFTPPLLGYNSASSIATSGQIVKVLIAYGLYLSTPLILDGVDKSLNTGGSPFGEAIAKDTKASAATLFAGAQSLFGSLTKNRFPEAR